MPRSPASAGTAHGNRAGRQTRRDTRDRDMDTRLSNRTGGGQNLGAGYQYRDAGHCARTDDPLPTAGAKPVWRRRISAHPAPETGLALAHSGGPTISLPTLVIA